jgi:hypothetical protein
MLEEGGDEEAYSGCRQNARWETAMQKAADVIKRPTAADDPNATDDRGAINISWRQSGVSAMMDALAGKRFSEPTAKDIIWLAIQDVMEMRLSQHHSVIIVSPDGVAKDLETESGSTAATAEPTTRPPFAEISRGLRAFRELLRGLFSKESDEPQSLLDSLPTRDPTAVAPPTPPIQEQHFSPLRELLHCTKLGRRLWIGSQRTAEAESLNALLPTQEFLETMRIHGEEIRQTQQLRRRDFILEGQSVLALQKAILRSLGAGNDPRTLAYETARAADVLHTARNLHQAESSRPA